MKSTYSASGIDERKSPEERHRLGIWYTPKPIADFIVRSTLGNLLGDEEQMRRLVILDPACGDGVFLVTAAEFLFQWWGERIGRELTQTERGRIVTTKLFGVDLDLEGVTMCKQHLASLAGCTPDEIVNVRHGNSLFGIHEVTPEQRAKLGSNPSREDYDRLLLDEENGSRERKGNPLNLEDIQAMHPIHWEYDFPGLSWADQPQAHGV